MSSKQHSQKITPKNQNKVFLYHKVSKDILVTQVSNVFDTWECSISINMKFIVNLSSLMFVPVLWQFAILYGYLENPPQTRG